MREQAYRTGRLHDGLGVEVGDDEVRVISTAPYSRFVHDGTADTEAVPFLREAATRVGSRAGSSSDDRPHWLGPRAHPRPRTIAAICAGRVGTEDRGKAWRPPMVICVDEGATRSPGAGRAANARIGLQVHTFAFRCYGQDRAQAAQLARLVSDLWHECGVFEGTGDPPVLVRNAWADLSRSPSRTQVFGVPMPPATSTSSVAPSRRAWWSEVCPERLRLSCPARAP